MDAPGESSGGGAPRLGSMFGRYRIDSLIGRGGMGVVVRALDVPLDRIVALKFIAPAFAGDPEAADRLLREARAAAAVEHPHIVPIHEVGWTDGIAFLAMRAISGSDLAGILRQEAPLPPERTLDLGAQIAEALDAAHARGLIHGDVKPANVLLEQRPGAPEWAWLTDFGLSQRTSGTTLPHTGGWQGTLDYLAPELITGGSIRPATDQYSLACVMVECLTGAPPWSGPTHAAVLHAHLHRDPAEIAPRLPEPRLAGPLVIALAKDPDARFADCRSLIEAMRLALSEAQPSPTRGPSVPADPTSDERITVPGAERTEHQWRQPGPSGSRPGRLPETGTPLIGREADIRDVERLLREHRLVTLVGAGGSGKTRLAIAVARHLQPDLPDDVVFVALEEARDRDAASVAIADALGVTGRMGMDLVEVIEAHLADRRLLLVLDNFEQVLEAAPIVSRFITAAPDIRILVTSRAPLRIAAEQEREVLPLDPGPASLMFVQRAGAIRATFDPGPHQAAIDAIVRRLDGLPLAVELAAAQVRHLTPETILARLEASLPVLEGGGRDAPARHRTLRAALEWSHDLLDVPTRHLFAAVSVFGGGWTLEGAERVCSGDDPDEAGVLSGLAQLVERSLVRATETDGQGMRYSMHQLTREYAAERLADGSAQGVVERRHAEWILGLVREAEPNLVLTGLRAWQERLRAEEDNIRQALRWAILHGPHDAAATDLGLEIAGSLWRFWFHWAASREGVTWLEAVLALPGAATVGFPRARALSSLAALWWHQGRFNDSLETYLEVVAILRALDVTDERLGDALDDAAWAADLGGEVALAVQLTEEKWRHPRTLRSYRIDGWVGRDLDLARVSIGQDGGAVAADRLLEAIEAILDEVDRSDQALFAAHLRATIGSWYGLLGRTDRAVEHEHEALRRYRELGHLGQIPIMLLSRGLYELKLGRPDRALRLAVAGGRESVEVGGTVISERDWAGVGQLDLAAAALLPADEVARGLREGRAMSMDQAVAYALHELPEETPRSARHDRHDLTAREREVLALVADGRTDGEIAEALVISKKTASVHVASIKGKLGAGSRAEIVSIALRGGRVRDG